MSALPKIRIALRDWDWLTPLLLGDIPQSDHVTLERVQDLPDSLVFDPAFDAVEMSFSQAARYAAAQDPRLVALPVFVMRAFRHRCGIVRQNSDVTRFEQLKGATIGMTGWQDTGSVWTRGLLSDAGVGPEDANWIVGRVSHKDPAPSPLSDGMLGNPKALSSDDSLVEALARGTIDALFSPFVPDALNAPNAGLRRLLPDPDQAEAEWAQRTGYVPGLHVIGMRRTIAKARPDIAATLPNLLRASRDKWRLKRQRMAETTPWMASAFDAERRNLPDQWDADGLAANRPMINCFLSLLQTQGVIEYRPSLEELFPEFPLQGKYL